MCHPLQARHVPALVELESELRVALAGVQSRRIYEATARDALGGDNRAICLICEVDGQVAGFVLALIHPAAYWKDFARRHPLLAVRVLLGRLKRRAPDGASEPDARQENSLLESGAAPGNWGESNRSIAKIQFIGVRAAFRGRGIARELYSALAAEMRARGITRIDAHISAGNDASIRMHHAAGWKLYRDAGGVLAIYAIDSLK